MTILPIAYLGGVEWFSYLARGGGVIDVGENWVKQTARNRAEILTANGVAALTVPVHGNGAKIATRDVRIDNSKRWQHTHWLSMVSAYRNSPFFDHWEDRFAGVYARRFDFLVDLNLELLEITAAALGLGGAFTISETYVDASPGDLDLRGKKALRRPWGAFASAASSATSSADPAYEKPPFREYTQVFYDRTSFVPGLSVVDLIFCEGPAARGVLG